jgi:ADP-heptose:LPS heptosyltransferase
MKKYLNTYIVEGGVGKCTAFTALIPKLKNKDGQPIQIHTPYVDVFAYNPDVKMAFDSSTISLKDPRLQLSNNFFYNEPYKSNFQFGKEHIIESYCKLFNVPYDISMRPKLFTDHLESYAKVWLDKNNIKGKYILIQFTGGQSPVNWNISNSYNNINPGRIYPQFLAQQVIDKIKKENKDITIIDCSLPNEPSYMNTVKCTEHWTLIHELLKNSEGFIAIDSCLNHFSASTGTKGVVIWGPTRWTQFGYSHNKNLHFHMKDEWNENKFIESDPRNILVDPEIVFQAYKNINKNKTKEVFCAIK